MVEEDGDIDISAFNGLTTRATLIKCEKSCTNRRTRRCQGMKNVYEVLRQKELELARLEKEVEALRVAAPLLSEDKEMLAEAVNSKPTLAPPTPAQQPIRIPAPVAAQAVNQPSRAAGWEDAAKRWP